MQASCISHKIMLLLLWKPMLSKHCLYWWSRTSCLYMIPHSAREKKLQYIVKQQRKLLQSICNIKCCFRYKIILKQNNMLQYFQNVKFHVVLLLYGNLPLRSDPVYLSRVAVCLPPCNGHGWFGPVRTVVMDHRD